MVDLYVEDEADQRIEDIKKFFGDCGCDREWIIERQDGLMVVNCRVNVMALMPDDMDKGFSLTKICEMREICPFYCEAAE
jgi:hypothetical protein